MNRRGKSSGRGHSGDPRKRAPRQPPGRRPEPPEQDLVNDIDQALADPHPLGMLALASSLAAALDPKIATEASDGPSGLPPVAELVDMLAGGGQPQTEALAWVLAHLTLEELPRARVLRSLDSTRLPPWMSELAHTKVSGAWQTLDTLKDGSNICLGVEIGDVDLTVVTFLDFNNEGAVKDGFVVPESLAAFQQTFTRLAPSAGLEFSELSVADARTQIEEGLEAARTYWPPFESDTWPQLRPFLEFVLQRCPSDGELMAMPQWDRERATEAVIDFFGSAVGRPLMRDRDQIQLLGSWMDFATTNGYGDPLLISGSKIEIFLLDWVQERLATSRTALAKLPRLLAVFVPYAHQQRGLGPGETASTLATLAQVTPDFLAGVERFGAPPDAAGADVDIEQLYLELYAEEVGGLAEFERLDHRPLPAEELMLDAVPEDLHHRLRTIDSILADRGQVLGDPEVITAVRRLTHDIAVADPEVFRRRAKDLNTAAALCYLVARANHLVGPGAATRADRFLGHFGVTSVSTRAESLRAAVVSRTDESRTGLENARYLTSTYRQALINRWSAHQAQLREALAAHRSGGG